MTTDKPVKPPAVISSAISEKSYPGKFRQNVCQLNEQITIIQITDNFQEAIIESSKRFGRCLH